MVRPMAAPKIRIRPLTILFLVAAVVLTAAGIYYFVTPAHSLPVFVPGHEAHGTNHHIKHGIAMIGLAIIALVAAWFTTAPDRPADST
jgi:hypothetical protein